MTASLVQRCNGLVEGEVDLECAVAWFLDAAARGDAWAVFNLGFAYQFGHEDAVRQRDIAAAFMTPAELGKAQRAAREWSTAPPAH